MDRAQQKYPPIADYALIGNCYCSALVSRNGSVDWCCMPRVDADSCFGRLLDWEKGGYWAIAPADDDYASTRSYVPDTMILETRFSTGSGEARLYDFFLMDPEQADGPPHVHVRIIDGIRGEVEMRMEMRPRFDYGAIIPRMQRAPIGVHTAIGSNKGLMIHADVELQIVEHRDLAAGFRVGAGERVRMVVQFEFPELIDSSLSRALRDPDAIDRHFEATRRWWQDWSARIHSPHELDIQTLRSTITLKSLTIDNTGAIVAAPTTSLPESIGGVRNWDYRFSWVRDSVFVLRALHALGCYAEADRFHRFIQRSSAGSARQLQVMYGVDGKRRLTEIELDWLDGYRGSRPVRIGNRAAEQKQLDIYGELLAMAWEWHMRGQNIDGDYWDFLIDVIDTACECWQDPDRGIWEDRSEPTHHVHSKAMCWLALNRGIHLAQDRRLPAPLERWARIREEIRAATERRGYNERRGVFVRSYDSDYLDAALLLLPRIGFVAYDDPRMLRTVDAICRDLDCNGLLRRYDAPDSLPPGEGVFLPCTFWLVSCLARQGRVEQAWGYYRRALACANDVGLFSEEFDVDTGQMLGNFPQGLTHVSQITARLALAQAGAPA